jgi:hypothetical protein
MCEEPKRRNLYECGKSGFGDCGMQGRATNLGQCFRLPGLGLDSSFIHQHDGDIVFDRVNPVALCALQALWILAVLERLLAGRTNQHVEEVFGKHDCVLYDRTLFTTEAPRHRENLFGENAIEHRNEIRVAISPNCSFICFLCVSVPPW